MPRLSLLTDVSSQDIFDLLLLEATFDHQASTAVNRTSGAEFSKQVLNDMLWLSMHLFANVGDIGENAAFVAVAHHARRRNGVTLFTRPGEARVGVIE